MQEVYINNPIEVEVLNSEKTFEGRSLLKPLNDINYNFYLDKVGSEINSLNQEFSHSIQGNIGGEHVKRAKPSSSSLSSYTLHSESTSASLMPRRFSEPFKYKFSFENSNSTNTQREFESSFWGSDYKGVINYKKFSIGSNVDQSTVKKHIKNPRLVSFKGELLLIFEINASVFNSSDSHREVRVYRKSKNLGSFVLVKRFNSIPVDEPGYGRSSRGLQSGSPDATVSDGTLYLSYRSVGDTNKVVLWKTEDLQNWESTEVLKGFSDSLNYNIRSNSNPYKFGFRQRISSYENNICIVYYGIKTVEKFKKNTEIRDFRVIVSYDGGESFETSNTNYSTFTEDVSENFRESEQYLGSTSFFIPFSLDREGNRAFEQNFIPNFDLYYDRNMGSFVILKIGSPFSLNSDLSDKFDGFYDGDGNRASSYLIGLKTKGGNLLDWEQCLSINLDKSYLGVKSSFFSANTDHYNFPNSDQSNLKGYKRIVDVSVNGGETINDLYLVSQIGYDNQTVENNFEITTTHSEFCFLDDSRFNFYENQPNLNNLTAFGGFFNDGDDSVSDSSVSEKWYFCSSPIDYRNSGYDTNYLKEEKDKVLSGVSKRFYYSPFSCSHLGQNLFGLKSKLGDQKKVLDLCYTSSAGKNNEKLPYDFNFNSSLGDIYEYDSLFTNTTTIVPNNNVFSISSNGEKTYVTTSNQTVSKYTNFSFNSLNSFDIKPYNFKFKLGLVFSSLPDGSDYQLNFFNIGFLYFYLNQDGDVLLDDTTDQHWTGKKNLFQIDFDKNVEIICQLRYKAQVDQSEIVVWYKVGEAERKLVQTDLSVTNIWQEIYSNFWDDVELGIISYDNFREFEVSLNYFHYGHYNFVDLLNAPNTMFSFFDFEPVFTEERGSLNSKFQEGIVLSSDSNDHSIYQNRYDNSFYLTDGSNVRLEGPKQLVLRDEFKYIGSKTKNSSENVVNSLPDSVYDFTNDAQSNPRVRVAFENLNYLSFDAISFINIDGVYQINLVVENVEGVLDHCNVNYKANSNVDLNSPRRFIDGEALSIGDHVLLNNQNNLVENGIYKVDSFSSWSRVSYFQSGDTKSRGFSVYIDNGLANRNVLYTLAGDSQSYQIGTDEIYFAVNSLPTNIAHKLIGQDDCFGLDKVEGDIFYLNGSDFFDRKLERYSIFSLDVSTGKWVDQYKVERNYGNKIQVNKDIVTGSNIEYFLFRNSITIDQFTELEPVFIQDLEYQSASDSDRNFIIQYIESGYNSSLQLNYDIPSDSSFPINIDVYLETDSNGDSVSTATEIKNLLENQSDLLNYINIVLFGTSSNVQEETERVYSTNYITENNFSKFALDFHSVENPELASVGQIVFGNIEELTTHIPEDGFDFSVSSQYDLVESEFGKVFNSNTAYQNPFNLSNLFQSVSLTLRGITSDNRYFDKYFNIFHRFAERNLSFPILLSNENISFTEYANVSNDFERSWDDWYKSMSINLDLKDWMAKSNRTLFETNPVIVEIVADPDQVKTGQTISFEVIAFDPLGGNLSYNWDFGDGSSGTGKTVSHSFSESGEYEVRCEVSSDKGFSTVNAKIIKVIDRVVDSFNISYSSPNLDEIFKLTIEAVDENNNKVSNYQDALFELDTKGKNWLAIYNEGFGIEDNVEQDDIDFKYYQDFDKIVRGQLFTKSIVDGEVNFYLQPESTSDVNVEILSDVLDKKISINPIQKSFNSPSAYTTGSWDTDGFIHLESSSQYSVQSIDTSNQYVKGLVQEEVSSNAFKNTSVTLRDDFVGLKALNLTDGSEAEITSIDKSSGQITTSSLSGGEDNIWQKGDIFHIKYIDIYSSIYDKNNQDTGSIEKVDGFGNNQTILSTLSVSSDVFYKNIRGVQDSSKFSYYFFGFNGFTYRMDESGSLVEQIFEDFSNSDISIGNENAITVSRSSLLSWGNSSEFVYYNDFNDNTIYKFDNTLSKINSFQDPILSGVKKIVAGFDDVIYCISSNDQDVFAISVVKNSILWEQTSVFGADNISAFSLDFSENYLYVGSENGDVQRLDVSNGNLDYSSVLSTNSSSLSVTNLDFDRDENVYGTIELDVGGSGKTDTFKINSESKSFDWKVSNESITQHLEEIKDLSVDWFFNVYTGDKDAKIRKISQ